MKAVTYISVFVGGAVVCFLFISLGIIQKADGIPGAQQDPLLALPTYLGFLSVMLTAVTAVLAALAIGIGIVAAYTFREIKDEAFRAVTTKINEALSEEAINTRVDKMLASRANPTIAELEAGFDPNDDGNR